MLFIWWMITRESARGISTAPNQRAVDNLLWGEIRRLHRSSEVLSQIGEVLEVSEYRIDRAKGWFGLGFASDKPQHLEGHHSPTAAILIVDEAKAVPGSVRTALQGMLDAPESMLVAASTPWRDEGWYYDMDVKGGSEVMRIVVTIDDLIAEGIDSAVAAREDYVRQFGSEESPEFQSRALARYISSSPWGDIRPDALEACMEREPARQGRKVASLDVARGDSESNDESVIGLSQGEDLLELIPFKTTDLVAATRRLVSEAKRFGADLIRPDANGIGAGPSDIIKAEGWPAHQIDEFVAQSRASQPDRFDSRAAEAGWSFATKVNRREIALPQDREFRKQCLQIRFVPRSGGRLGIDKSPRIDGVATSSPDRFDAAMMALAPEYGGGIGLFRFLEGAKKHEPTKQT